MNILAWDKQRHALGMDEMDTTHQEFIKLVNLVALAPKETFSFQFNVLKAHTEAHFAREEELMEKSGFRAIQEHKGDHARILRDLNQFAKMVERGSIAAPRAYVREGMPKWFDQHIATMDSALAAHINEHLSVLSATKRIA